MKLTVDGRSYDVDVEPEMPLLWALRDEIGVVAPKYGCGAGLCGACTVRIAGEAVRSCQTPVGDVAGPVTTLAGLTRANQDAQGGLHPAQQAWIKHQVAQCGYCQPGWIMSVATLYDATPRPRLAEVERALSSHLCRCGSYPQIRAALAELFEGGEA